MTATTLPAAGPAASGGTLAGTGTLLRFMLRRDRVRFPAWTLGVALLMGYFTTALNSVYTTTEQLESVSAFSTSPAGAIFGGSGYGYDAITLERFLSGQYGLYVMLLAALMALLTVTRHTRAEERSGRAELVRANVVGRSAQLTAALILTALMSATAAALVTAIMLAAGYAAAGSALFGASVGAVGLVFGGITAIAVQIFAYPGPPPGSPERSSAPPSSCGASATWPPSRTAGRPGCHGCPRSAGPSRPRPTCSTGGGRWPCPWFAPPRPPPPDTAW